jgi:hypothetical protein
MSLILQGSTSGSITLQEPAVAGSTVLTLPATSGNVVVDSATQTLTNKTIQGGTITSGTAVASTSGTSIDFTGIPSWVKRVTVMYNGVSTNGSSIIQIQVGSSSVSTSGYRSTASFGVSATNFIYLATGFAVNTSYSGSSNINSGIYTLTLIGSNTWVGSGTNGGDSSGQIAWACAGNSPALGGALDRVRITTVNGTDTFDAGSINILYE